MAVSTAVLMSAYDIPLASVSVPDMFSVSEETALTLTFAHIGAIPSPSPLLGSTAFCTLVTSAAVGTV